MNKADNKTDTRAIPVLTDQSSDSELTMRAGQGDARAFELIMRRHNRLLFRTARSILKNDADTEDAVQEAYLSAWRALSKFRADAKLSTWLVRIVVNEALGRLRRSGAKVIPLDSAVDSALQPIESSIETFIETRIETQIERQADIDSNEQPERRAMHSQMKCLIEARIDALPDVFRTVFMLRAVEELTVEEVAVALEIPEATVRSRFFRARGLLRESLARDVDVAIDSAFSFAGVRCDRIVACVLKKIAPEITSGTTPCL